MWQNYYPWDSIFNNKTLESSYYLPNYMHMYMYMMSHITFALRNPSFSRGSQCIFETLSVKKVLAIRALHACQWFSACKTQIHYVTPQSGSMKHSLSLNKNCSIKKVFFFSNYLISVVWWNVFVRNIERSIIGNKYRFTQKKTMQKKSCSCNDRHRRV